MYFSLRSLVVVSIGIVAIVSSVVFLRTADQLPTSLLDESSLAAVQSVSREIPVTIKVTQPAKTTKSKKAQPVPKVQVGLPVSIRIPKIGVNTSVEHIGLTAAGVMGAPKGPTTTAWYKGGARPGEKGSAVIDGHYGWKNGIKAAFDDLDMLTPGDNIYVEDEKGAITVFVVREVRSFGEHENAVTVFHSTDGKAHLNLITCGGAWDKSQKSYSNRLVIFADKQEFHSAFWPIFFTILLKAANSST